MWEEELMWEEEFGSYSGIWRWKVEMGSGKWKWEVESRKVLGVIKVELR
jgi:hypothetical protein